MKIKNFQAREILDSRGNPTVLCSVTLSSGVSADASVPSGASTGIHEALELRDGDPERYHGKGVQKACKHIETRILRKLIGMDSRKQRDIDQAMIDLDGTENKSSLGANAILAVSMACVRAAALAQKKPLYRWMREVYGISEKKFVMPLATMNIFNGGKHANNGLSIQEFMIIPHAKRFRDRVRMGAEIFHTLKSLLAKKGFLTLVGDEGGFADGPKDNEAVVKLLLDAIAKSGYQAGHDVFLGCDFAASEFYNKNKYEFAKKGIWWEADKLMDTIERWLSKYPFEVLEDPLAEDDWDSWQALTKVVHDRAALVGDDLFVTNVKRLQTGIDMKVANAILIKVNQIGSLSQTIDAIMLAKKHHYQVIVSHRSGETGDDFIADLACAVNADYIKTGSLSRSERVEKYNRLMAIEEELKL